jgi:uncharacterized Ntn-hydrolase superfamily protein
MKNTFLFLIIFCINVFASQTSRRPVNTYSIVAYDSVNGQMGVAVQSHWFSVGTVVSWAEAGVGVVATQSFVDISYGPLGLDLMRGGKTAQQALQALLETDGERDVRQVAMIDVHGNVAVHTGKKCIEAAGQQSGKGFSAQANMMENNRVWPAMAEAYQNSKGDLLSRLMTALKAAQAEGGDIRGKQSIAILIVPIKTKGQPWKEKIVDLRIDDYPEPLKEMERLIKVHRAYEHMNKGDEYMALKDVTAAMKEYRTASEIYPENMEIMYWTAVTMASEGMVNESLPIFRDVFKKEPVWKELTKRLPKAELLPDDKDLLVKILNSSD